jgi:hypothetical protein
MEGSMLELWKPCPGFSFYEVSSLGRIQSLDKTISHKNRFGFCTYVKSTYVKKGKLLKIMPEPYPHVTLHADDGKSQTIANIHRLVCEAFHGTPPPDRPHTLHRDDNRQNNRSSNLYWGTHGDNGKDKVRNGRSLVREKHHKTVLTPQQVAEIKTRYTPKHPTNGSYAMAKEFCVHRTTIENIVAGRTCKP